jgi:uncharacterized membrane protein YjgN (DUF898 family)
MRLAPIILNHEYRPKFNGTSDELAPIGIKNYFYNICSLGIYSFWGQAESIEYLLSHITIGGQNFSYRGDGEEALRQMRLPILSGIILLVLPLSMARFSQHALWFILLSVFSLAWFDVRRRQYVLRHSFFGVRPFVWKVDEKKYVFNYGFGLLLTFLTAGLWLPVWRHFLTKTRFSGLSLGEIEFTYTGKLGESAVEFYWSAIFVCASLGLYFPWYLARRDRYKIANIWLGGKELGCARGYLKTSGSENFLLLATHCSLLILTFGLALPWIKINRHAQLFKNLAFIGNLNLNQFNDAPLTHDGKIKD